MSATFPKEQSEDLYKEKLSTEAYRVLRQNGTEYPFTGLYDKHFDTPARHIHKATHTRTHTHTHTHAHTHTRTHAHTRWESF